MIRHVVTLLRFLADWVERPGTPHLRRMAFCEICGVRTLRLSRPLLRTHRVREDSVSLCSGCWEDVRPRSSGLSFEIRSLRLERVDDEADAA